MDISAEPELAKATLIHGVVSDMLFQNEFSYAHFPEIVDLAVVVSGLGMLQSNMGFVKSTSSFWDSTEWELVPRPFLDTQSLAYANAIAAWSRGDSDPVWANELTPEVRKPMKKALKYLSKTNDSFFQTEVSSRLSLKASQEKWLALIASDSVSTKVISIRHLDFDDQSNAQLQETLLDGLQSRNQTVRLHSISATQRVKEEYSQAIADELRVLVEDRDDETRAKAMCSLTRARQLDELTIEIAAKMLDSEAKFVVFAGVLALSSLESVPEDAMPRVDRAFVRSLQVCDYEFIGLFASAYNRWLKDPQSHFEQLLERDSPEYLQIAIGALKNARDQLVSLAG